MASGWLTLPFFHGGGEDRVGCRFGSSEVEWYGVWCIGG